MPKTRRRAGRQPREGMRFMADVLGENIRSHRVLSKLSQTELAERMSQLGYPWLRATVSEVERAERIVTTDELLAVALVLDVNPVMDLLDPRGVGGRGTAPIDFGGTTTPLPVEFVSAWVHGERVVWVRWYPDGPKVFGGKYGTEDVVPSDEEGERQ